MVKAIFYIYCVVIALSVSEATQLSSQPTSTYQTISIYNKSKIIYPLIQHRLPQPYHRILTQPLLTLGLKKYYQQTPYIHVIYAKKDLTNHTYHRAILMLIDKKVGSNNVQVAQSKKEVKIIELAFITINFAALPEKLTGEILNTTASFGQLLLTYHIKVITRDRIYFTTQCDKMISSLTGCIKNKMLYGRTNTIVNALDNRWLAHVVEILM